MEAFRCVTVFKKDGIGDVVLEMNTSNAYVQGSYCFSDPSEYYTSQFLVSNDLNYTEFHITFNNFDSYKDWYNVFGEIVEELMAIMKDDFKPYNITIERYFDNVELSGVADALPYTSFKSKLLPQDNSNLSDDIEQI